MDTKKKDESKGSWVTPDKFEMDCRPPRRETGIKISDRLQKRIDEAQAEKAKSAKG